MNRSLRILSLSISLYLSLLLVEARADDCSPGKVASTSDCSNLGGDSCEIPTAYCECGEGCHSDEGFLGFIKGCRKVGWFGCESNAKPRGPVGHPCRCVPDKPTTGVNGTEEIAKAEPEVVADQALQLQAQGLVEIVCKRPMDCPPGSSCISGHCKNEQSGRFGNHGR